MKNSIWSLLFISGMLAVACGVSGGDSDTDSDTSVDRVCTPGLTQACVCPGGSVSGAQACAADGASWGICDCGSGDTDSATSGDTDTDTDADTDSDSDITPGACENTLRVVYRDFTSDHPDFERTYPGWGPCQGMVQPILGSDRKPVFNKINGEYQVTDSNCAATCPDGGDLTGPNVISRPTTDADPNPMWEGAAMFSDWYNDVSGVNMNIPGELRLTNDGDGSFVYDNAFFFPVDGQGFGAEPGQVDENGTAHNFLFTTEIHFQFEYTGGETFSFRGDDDVWIFVNGKIALDLGGMHWPYYDLIDFDARAAELGITPGNVYIVDIFHAERHSTASNFRIQTNIACFIGPLD